MDCMGNQQPAYRSKETLRQMYYEDEMTIQEMADEFGCTKTTVCYWMDKYDMQRRYSGTLKERFEQYHEKDANENGCWLWQNQPDEWGYGTITDGDKTRKAHRVAFDLYRDEPLPEFSPDAQVNHTCHNPDCVNPDHLYIGTAKENMNDALDVESWGGDDRARGSEIGNSKISEDDVKEIKRRCQSGETQKAVAADFPISHSMVNKIMTGQWWAHVEVDE